MDAEVGEVPVGIVGRETELAAVRGFLADDSPVRTLVLSGGAGIGKTTLWEAGIGAARERGARVLLARPTGAEARLSFAALIDLCAAVDTGAIAGLPAPQRAALEVALLRAEPTVRTAEPLAIALGLLNGVRALAERGPLLVAIDDLQWLDPPSADALTFVARRLGNEHIRFLLAKRPGSRTAFERALERRAMERLDVGPLSFGATRQLLFERLGLSLSRQLLRRIVDSTLGNPLFVLEVGRVLAERGIPEIGEAVPVPDTVEELLGTRVAGLPRATRKLLLAVALSADLRLDELAAVVGGSAVEDAVQDGVLIVDSERVRPSHPLLAAAARKRSRPRERRELHRAWRPRLPARCARVHGCSCLSRSARRTGMSSSVISSWRWRNAMAIPACVRMCWRRTRRTPQPARSQGFEQPSGGHLRRCKPRARQGAIRSGSRCMRWAGLAR